MRFIAHLNESFENKIFAVIDTFMTSKNIKDVDTLLSHESLTDLLDLINDTFEIGRITVSQGPQPDITGQSTGDSINVTIPYRAPLDTKLRISMLGTLFHELSHHFQFSDQGAMAQLAQGYKSDINSSYKFVQYFLQKAERYPKAISTAITCLIENIDVLGDVEEIKKIASKAKKQSDIEELTADLVSKYNIYAYSFIPVADFYMVAFYAYGTQVADITKEDKRSIRNKFDVFMRNLKKAYIGFQHYFKKYKII